MDQFESHPQRSMDLKLYHLPAKALKIVPGRLAIVYQVNKILLTQKAMLNDLDELRDYLYTTYVLTSRVDAPACYCVWLSATASERGGTYGSSRT